MGSRSTNAECVLCGGLAAYCGCENVPIAECPMGELEVAMATAILFMPEIGHLTAGVTKEIIRRCARVARKHFDGSPHWVGVDGNCDRCGQHEPPEGSRCPTQFDGDARASAPEVGG